MTTDHAPSDPLRSLSRLAEELNLCAKELAAIDRNSAMSSGLHGFDIAYQLQSIEKLLDESRKLAAGIRHRVWSEAGMQHNSAVAINHIPPEILSRVFELVQGDCLWPVIPAWITSRWQPPKPPRGRNTWIRVTAVCRLWNAIARNHPFLWNSIYIHRTDSPEYCLEWVRRSSGVPLDVLIDDFDYAQDFFATEFPSWCSRLRRLEIRGINSPGRLASLFNQRAPFLQSFTVVNPRLNGAIPWCIFSNDTPRIQHLFLDYLWQPTQNSFTSLTHITLRSPMGVFLGDLVELLRANRGVESLILCGAYFQREAQRAGFSIGDGVVIQLPRLKRLVLDKCDGRILSYISPHIEFPEHGVSILYKLSWADAIETVLPSVERARIPPLHDTRVLRISDRRRVSILAASSTSVIRIYGTMNGPRPEMPNLPPVMALHALQELRILGGASRFLAWWRELLSRMPSLTKLVFERTQPAILEMLSDPEGPSCPVPSLQTLVVIPHAFNDEWNYPDTLMAILAERQTKGHRLRTLHVVCEGAHAKVSRRFSTKTFRSLEEHRELLENYVDDLRFDFISDGSYPALELPAQCQAWIDGA